MHAEWVLVNAGVVDKDSPIPRKFLLRPEQVEVVDTWHVDGMAATGSQDIVVRDAFVPERYVSLPLGSAGDGEVAYLSRIPVLPFLALTAGIPALGAARRAVTLFRELVGKRVRFGTHRVQAQNVASQIRLANAYTRVRAAESAMRECARAVESQARGDISPSEVEQIQCRLAIGRVVHECLGAVRDIMDAAGSSVHFDGQELGRIHRDVQMMSTHTIFDLELASQQCGKAMLEVEGDLFSFR
ncbi:MAG: acyl-CoA dehydrogenase family protein [Pseudomonadales bacterium]